MSDYLSLIVNSGQVNTPPGSYHTVKEWIKNSFLGPRSHVLEIGCSTGFITIEIARYVQARCCGLDSHEQSIKIAQKNIDPDITKHVSFVVGDTNQLPFVDNEFSHLIIGGHLPFVPPESRWGHVTQAIRAIKPWGYVLTALYFYKSRPPQALLDQFNSEVGTCLEADHDYSYWNGLFENRRLLLEYESVYDVIPPDSERIRVYLDQLKHDSRKEWKKRLRLFKENGSYLNYFVRVYRKVPDHKNLMVQVPRGGIYRTKQISQQSL